MYQARQRAIRAIFILEYNSEIISIYGHADDFFAEHTLDNANDPKWREIITCISLTTYEFQQMFPEDSPTRNSTKPMRYIYLHTLWSDVNGKYIVSEKVGKEFAAWFDGLCANQVKTFFNKLPSGEHFQKNRKMFIDAFEEYFSLPLRGERRWFNPKERQQTAEKTELRCQWIYPDGRLCDEKLSNEEGQIDHVRPYSAGGRTILENARWICSSRNKGRGTKCIRDITT